LGNQIIVGTFLAYTHVAQQQTTSRVTQPHDYTSFIWDEFKFIPIIGSTTGIEVGSILFFPLTYFKATHKQNLFYYPSISNPHYLPPPIKNPKPRRHSKAKAMFQKMVLQKQW
jgi:hypothetical protein